MKTNANPYKAIEKFCYKMASTLKEWYHNLGTIKQDQFDSLNTIAAVLKAIHQEFIKDSDLIDKKLRQEFFEMRCCSLKIKDLERHFQRMSKRFYLLNVLKDHSPKNMYVPCNIVITNLLKTLLSIPLSMNEQHIKIDCHIVKEKIQSKLLHLLSISIIDQLVDILTNFLDSILFQKLLSSE
ncbi:hypothetical protein CR513_52401, partial [Mucuna pruriens]